MLLKSFSFIHLLIVGLLVIRVSLAIGLWRQRGQKQQARFRRLKAHDRQKEFRGVRFRASSFYFARGKYTKVLRVMGKKS